MFLKANLAAFPDRITSGISGVEFYHRYKDSETGDLFVEPRRPFDATEVSDWAASQGYTVFNSPDEFWNANIRPAGPPPPHGEAAPAPEPEPDQTYDLDVLKGIRHRQIDEKTDSLIAAGFTYNTKTFSLSANAQLTWLGMYTSRVDLSYPVTVNTIDDADTESLTDANEVAAFYAAGLAQIRTHLDSGTALKQQVTAATDTAGVDAVVDNR